MGAFNFFVTRDLDMEATILAEDELEVATQTKVEIGVIEEEVKTPDTDEIMKDVTSSLQDYTFSKAEIFYLEHQHSNPKDIWK